MSYQKIGAPVHEHIVRGNTATVEVSKGDVLLLIKERINPYGAKEEIVSLGLFLDRESAIDLARYLLDAAVIIDPLNPYGDK